MPKLPKALTEAEVVEQMLMNAKATAMQDEIMYRYYKRAELSGAREAAQASKQIGAKVEATKSLIKFLEEEHKRVCLGISSSVLEK